MNFLKAFGSSLLLAFIPALVVLGVFSFAAGELFLPKQGALLVLICGMTALSFFRALALTFED